MGIWVKRGDDRTQSRMMKYMNWTTKAILSKVRVSTRTAASFPGLNSSMTGKGTGQKWLSIPLTEVSHHNMDMNMTEEIIWSG